MKLYKRFKVRDGHDLRTVDIPLELADQWKGETYSDYKEFFIKNFDVFLQALEEERHRRKRK